MASLTGADHTPGSSHSEGPRRGCSLPPGSCSPRRWHVWRNIASAVRRSLSTASTPPPCTSQTGIPSRMTSSVVKRWEPMVQATAGTASRKTWQHYKAPGGNRRPCRDSSAGHRHHLAAEVFGLPGCCSSGPREREPPVIRRRKSIQAEQVNLSTECSIPQPSLSGITPSFRTANSPERTRGPL
jgi:hypothetical protein